MKTDNLKLIKKCLLLERNVIADAVEKTTIARNEAPPPTESHSDTSRAQADTLLSELKMKLLNLDELLNNLPQQLSDNDKAFLWGHFESDINNTKVNFIIVPDGYGGREIDGIKLISVSTPLAQKIIKKGESINSFNLK